MSLFGAKCVCLVTGASRGIGREIALQVAAAVGANSALILTGRDAAALEAVKTELLAGNAQLTVVCIVHDLAVPVCQGVNKSSPFETQLRQLLKSHGTFDLGLVVHNGGSLGDMQLKASQLNDASAWHDYLQANLVSCIELNCTFVSVVSSNAAKRRIIVNISSLLAIQPMPSFAQYSVGKAAREAYFGVLAAEDTSLRVLNYAPGPVQTNMISTILTQSHSEQIKNSFQTMQDDSKILTPGQTVKKLINMVNEDTFQSGAHIDYFDIP